MIHLGDQLLSGNCFFSLMVFLVFNNRSTPKATHIKPHDKILKTIFINFRLLICFKKILTSVRLLKTIQKHDSIVFLLLNYSTNKKSYQHNSTHVLEIIMFYHFFRNIKYKLFISILYSYNI